MRVALLIQYDGLRYYGWQVQSDPQTIQGVLESALKMVFHVRIRLHGSGRTDSGVHALGQVAHFDIKETPIPAQNMWKALNQKLPEDIRILASMHVENDFHSRFNAIRREYCYEISLIPNILGRNRQWQIQYPLEIGILHELSLMVLGTHDFSSFCYAGTDTENRVCDIQTAVWSQISQGTLSFTVSGNRFLHHMVRMLVGNMIEVARGKWNLDHFKRLINHPDSQALTVSAPPHGLLLKQVTYPADLQPNWLVKTPQKTY